MSHCFTSPVSLCPHCILHAPHTSLEKQQKGLGEGNEKEGCEYRRVKLLPTCSCLQLPIHLHIPFLISFNPVPHSFFLICPGTAPPSPPPHGQAVSTDPPCVSPTEAAALHSQPQAGIGAAAALHPGTAEHRRAGRDTGNRGGSSTGWGHSQSAHLQCSHSNISLQLPKTWHNCSQTGCSWPWGCSLSPLLLPGVLLYLSCAG